VLAQVRFAKANRASLHVRQPMSAGKLCMTGRCSIPSAPRTRTAPRIKNVCTVCRGSQSRSQKRLHLEAVYFDFDKSEPDFSCHQRVVPECDLSQETDMSVTLVGRADPRGHQPSTTGAL